MTARTAGAVGAVVTALALAVAAATAFTSPQQVIPKHATQLGVAPLATHGVADATFKRVLDLLGEKGTMDLLGICVYYSGLSMVMNVARTPTPPGLVPYAPPQA